MDWLFIIQYTCLIFMVINAIILGVSSIHVRWKNKRYEQSRWLLFVAMLGFALQFFVQMAGGFRAAGADMGALINTLFYPPFFTCMALGIYNIEVPQARFRQMFIVCGSIYAAIIASFIIGYSNAGSLRIGSWLYVMMLLHLANVAYCVSKITIAMKKRRKWLEAMSASDMLPFMRYAHVCLALLLAPVCAVPLAIFFTPIVCVIAPIILITFLVFSITFVALGYSYSPTDDILDIEGDKEFEKKEEHNAVAGNSATSSVRTVSTKQPTLTNERIEVIKTKLDEWCGKQGYKDSSVNMMMLSIAIGIPKDDLSQYFDQCLGSTFRIWLSDIRFNAAKEMMLKYPNYSNDIISTECGFSSRTHLYRVFKQRVDCTPTAWRERNPSWGGGNKD